MTREELPEGAIEIGPNEWYNKVYDKNDVWMGINEWHVNQKTDNLCGGWVPFDVESEYIPRHAARWAVASYEPLTLSPSLLCMNCQHHGFIRDGRWVSC